MIAEYARSLAALLSFDPALARRVREEVEDHLHESAADGIGGGTPEAQRRAIASFGDAPAIAAQIAVVALARQARQLGVTVLLVIGGIFLAMKARLAWYDLTQWEVCENLVPLTVLVGSIDRSVFWLALTGGLAGSAYLGLRPAPATFHPGYDSHLKAFYFLCGLAAAAIAAAVACDGILTALRLSGWEWSADFLVPVLSMALELACAVVLVVHIRGITRRAALAACAFQRGA